MQQIIHDFVPGMILSALAVEIVIQGTAGLATAPATHF